MPSEDCLQGCRVLLVEDETLVAFLIEDMLEEIGCKLSAFAASVRDAEGLAESLDIDAAVLDVNVGGTEVYPIAEILAARGIPFVFCTGYGTHGLPTKWREATVLAKPFTRSQLESALRKAMTSAGEK